MCKVVILQSNYIPWIGYFDLIANADIFVFYDEVQYTKNDWRNRNKIYTKNGLQWLTIPIAASAVKLKISEVELPKNDWQTSHYKSLQAYKKAPHFNQLDTLLENFYINKNWEKLSELNQHIIIEIAQYLGIPTRFVNSSELDLQGDRVERLINILRQLDATEYISGPSAADYLNGNEHLFSDNNIQLTYKTYPSYPEYVQLSSPFERYVSILDVIANVDKTRIKEHLNL